VRICGSAFAIRGIDVEDSIHDSKRWLLGGPLPRAGRQQGIEIQDRHRVQEFKRALAESL